MIDDFETDLLDDEFEEEELTDGAPANRTFIIIAGVMGAIVVIALICLGAYALRGNGQRDQRATEIAAAYAQQTEVAFAANQTETVAAYTKTPTSTPTATSTPRVTNTPVVVPTKAGSDSSNGEGNGSEVPSNAVDPRTATVIALTETAIAEATNSALLTQAAGGGTGTPGTLVPSATALPQGGFADEFGLPGLALMAVLAVIVIFLVRRMRLSTE